jgi:hypothetical protein
MHQRLFIAALLTGLLHTIANAIAEPTITFVDGRWNGGIDTGTDSKGPQECWARTTFGDGTAFTLAKRGDGSWYLRLSNPDWRLLPSHRYAMLALVDFYPQLRIFAEAKSQTRLEIENLDQISLLGLIENGHTIDLKSDGFNVKYDLEGSAKVIERVRNCFAD